MKAKTHSGAKKRFKVTANGKFRFNKAARRHLLVNKSKGQKRNFRKGITECHLGEIHRIKGLLHMN